MKLEIIQVPRFKKTLDSLVAKNKVLIKDFEDFKKKLAENPEIGDLIQGSGGVRKTRLKSSSSGKSSGFRVCYYYLIKDREIFLILIYPKNEQENLTSDQKIILKRFSNEIKKS